MSWLSKTAKSVAPIVNPIMWASGTLLSGKNPLKELSGIGAKPGPANPYGKPDLAYLADTSKLDYLKDPSLYKSLLDTSGYDFLKNPSAAAPSASKLDALPGQLKTFGSTYQAPGYSKSNSLYGDLVNSTSTPSSVDAVRSQLNSDQLNQLLTGIDTDTTHSIGSLKSDFLDRGLGGPGMISDIEGNSLAQAYGDANKNKAAARTSALQSELDLMKNRENQNIAARTAAAGAATGQDTQANQIAAAGAQSDVTGYNSGLLDSIKAKIAAEDSAAGRTNQNQLSYASLLDSGNKSYSAANQQGNDLFAQLLNGRDLGAAGISSSNYNNAVDAEYKYAKPGYLDQLLSGFVSGGGAALGKSLFS